MYVQRRDLLLKSLKDNSIAILPSAQIKSRNHDANYPFRQNSDFYYLTGFSEPDCVLVLLKAQQKTKIVLFNISDNKDLRIWIGKRLGQENAVKKLKVDKAYPIGKLTEMLPELMSDKATLYYTLGEDSQYDHKVLAILDFLRRKSRKGGASPIQVLDFKSLIHEMRLIKDNQEIILMKKSAKIAADAHQHLMRICGSKQYEDQLASEFEYKCRQQGAQALAYNTIVASGSNACILHYTKNNDKLREGNLVLVDAGCELDCYASDITRTFPVNGRFSESQKALYEVVLKAEVAAIDIIKPDITFNIIQETMVFVLTEGLVDLKILTGKVEDLIQKKAYSKYYMHSHHWLGLDVHDVGNYKPNNQWRVLEKNMVLTVEPGLYIQPDDQTIDPSFRGIGIRIEDDILVTEKGNEVLSSSVPKTINEIEKIMKTG